MTSSVLSRLNNGAANIKHNLIPLTAVVLTFAGLYFGFSKILFSLWWMWNGDPLRSIGMLMPIAALYFAIKNRDKLDWRIGSWCGLVLISLLLGLRYMSGEAGVFSVLYGDHYFSISPLSNGVTLCLYFTGAVLFFCGWSGLWRLRFPLFLLLFVNPVPGFLGLFDLSLQTIGAIVARWFASVLAVPVEPGVLKMMFAPHLGMFIAPGCDGLRGVSTMLCLSLIVGHYYNMLPLRHTLFVLCSVILAYGLNLVRLCCVVIYYRVALHVDAIAKLGGTIDYVIGGTLFFFAALFVFSYPRKNVPK